MSELRLEDIGAILSGLGLVALVLFGGMALIALWPKIGQVARALWHRYVVFQWRGYLSDTARVKHLRSSVMKNQVVRAFDYVDMAPRTVAEPEPPSSGAIPQMNAVEPEANGSLNPAELALNADEVAAVQKMIYHKLTAAKPSKSSTIQAGFGVSRGGSQLYQRASDIYDVLFGQPEPAVETPVAGRRTHARFTRNGLS